MSDYPKLLVNAGKHDNQYILIEDKAQEGPAWLAMFRCMDEWTSNYSYGDLSGRQESLLTAAREGHAWAAKELLDSRSGGEYESVYIESVDTPHNSRSDWMVNALVTMLLLGLPTPLEKAVRTLENTPSYECTFSKREVVDGELTETETMRLKVRHEPFSVYLYCLGPSKPVGQEAIYVEGNQVVAHSTGWRSVLGTLHLDPLGTRMMAGNRHPITNIGMKNLLSRLSGLYAQGVVKEYKGVDVKGRSCTCVEVTLKQPAEFHIVRLYIDDQRYIPVCMQAYGVSVNGVTPLIEEYHYTDFKFDALTDDDFDPDNPEYGY